MTAAIILGALDRAYRTSRAEIEGSLADPDGELAGLLGTEEETE